MPREQTSKLANEGSPLSDVVMAQLYRGELGRSDTWRTRLDTTTNWALTTAAAAISYAFSNPTAPHVVVLVGLGMVATFLLIEARRYRYYDIWIRRVRLMEDGFWAPLLRREPTDPDAIKELASEMSRPQLQLSLFSAVATRINRAYGPILLILFLSWFAKVFLHPTPANTWHEFAQRGHIGFLPGLAVLGFLALCFLAAVILVVSSLLARPPLGELQPRTRFRRRVLWDMFSRPYAVSHPRRSRKRSRSEQVRSR